jgi:hypothetical protein
MNSKSTITFCTSIAAIALLSVSGLILSQQALAARGSGNIGNVGHLYMGGLPGYPYFGGYPGYGGYPYITGYGHHYYDDYGGYPYHGGHHHHHHHHHH